MTIQSAIDKVVRRENLTAEEAFKALGIVMRGEATDAQIGGLLIGLRMKGETPEEIGGFARAMRNNAVKIFVADPDAVDTCGTGGDKADTFNISTTAAFVAAGAGVTIAKHGNRAVSSRSGSADVLKALGVNIEAPADVVSACVNEIGIGFLFAPALHPAMRYAIGPRRELGLRTVFNLLGPLSNPADARRQLLGVFDAYYAELLANALATIGTEHALVVYGMVGMDELSTCGETLIVEVQRDKVTCTTVKPDDFGLTEARLEDLVGGDPDACAIITRKILSGETGPRRDITVLNAAAAIYVGGKTISIFDAVQIAEQSLDSGAALAKLEALIERTK